MVSNKTLITLDVNYNDPKRPTVSGRELHANLKIKTRYPTWISRMIKYGFKEDCDFKSIKLERIQVEGTRDVKRIISDHYLTLEMAKSICMFQRTPAGIACGEYLNQIQQKGNN